MVEGKYETNLEPDKGMSKRRKWNWCGGDYFDSRCVISSEYGYVVQMPSFTGF